MAVGSHEEARKRAAALTALPCARVFCLRVFCRLISVRTRPEAARCVRASPRAGATSFRWAPIWAANEARTDGQILEIFNCVFSLLSARAEMSQRQTSAEPSEAASASASSICVRQSRSRRAEHEAACLSDTRRRRAIRKARYCVA